MSICKRCGAKVDWRKRDGRWYCYDYNTGVDHWDGCSKTRWEQVKKTGERYEIRDKEGRLIESGYRNSAHGTKKDYISSGKPR